MTAVTRLRSLLGNALLREQALMMRLDEVEGVLRAGREMAMLLEVLADEKIVPSPGECFEEIGRWAVACNRFNGLSCGAEPTDSSKGE